MSKIFQIACLATAGVCSSSALFAQAVSDDSGLEQIIVYGARQPIAANRSGSAVTLLDGGTIELDGRLTVGEQLRSLPGISLSRSGGQGALTQLRMRGGEANHVAVFIDGVRANDPSQSGEFDFAHLLSQGVGSVEVIRGPQSALWGSDAVSGVVNIVSARPETGFQLNALAESGSDEWSRLGGGIGASADRGSIMLNVARIDSDGYNASRSGDERDGYENTSTSLVGELSLTTNVSLSLSLRSIDSLTDFDGTDFATGLPADSLNTLDKQQLMQAVRLNAATLDGRWLHTVRIDRLDAENMTRTENAFAPTGFEDFRSDATVDSFVYQSSFDVNERNRITGAIERRDEKFVQRGAVSFGDPNRDEQMKTDSVVFEYDVRPTENLSFLLSWRGDDNDQFDDATTKRISGSWRIGGGGTRLRAAYGEGVKNPTFTERFGFFTDFIGNPLLTPERSASTEFGIDHTFTGTGVRLSATVFDEVLEDEINGFVFDFTTGGFTAANQPGESDRRGVEISGAWQPTDAFAMQFSWTALDAEEFTAPGLAATRETRRPEDTANLSMQWRTLADRLNIGLNMAWSSAQDDFFFPPVPPFRERVSLDSFNLLTLSADYDVTQSLRVYARIENGLDEDYEEVFGFRGADRQFFLGLKYRL